MDSSDAMYIVILLCLLVLSAFFSSAETCLTTISKIRIQSLCDSGNKRAKIVLKLKNNTPKMLSTILIGNNIVNLSASSLATTYAISISKRIGMDDKSSLITGIATGILTLLVLILGEIVPKSVATITAEKLSLAYARPVYYLCVLFTPLSFLLNKISRLVMRILHVDPNNQPQITEKELLTFVNASHRVGVIEREEREMITNVVDFGDSLAKDVMVPKADVQFANADFNYEELMDCYKEEKYTRMPVFAETEDNVIGVINLKDIFFYNGSKETFNVRSIMREPYFTYEYKKTSELFLEMKRNSIPMAIVLDEYGSTTGLLTLEDLVEEIVGEIRDEYDSNEEDEITRVSDKEYIVLGVTRLDDINEKLHIKIESENYDSIAGHIINLLDDFPVSGEEASDEFADYKVLKASNNRVDKVKITLK